MAKNKEVKTYATVIGVVQNGGKILLLKRTSTRHTSSNKWQPVSGYLGEREAAEEAVLREVKEETGLAGTIIRAGKIFEVTDDWGHWVVIPFLVKVESKKVQFDPREHSEVIWIKPDEITRFDLVAGVERDLAAVGIR